MSINDGLALIRRHDFEGALPLLAAEVRKRPDDAYAAYYLAYAFVGAQDPQPAVTLLAKIIEVHPDFTDAHTLLGLARIRTSDFAGATTEYEAVLGREPKNPAALRYAGGDMTGAVMLLRDAKRLRRPSLPEVSDAEITDRLLRYEAALQPLRKARGGLPDMPGWVLCIIGVTLALTFMASAGLPGAWNGMRHYQDGKARLATLDYAGCASEMEQAVEAVPTSPKAWAYQAYCYLLDKDAKAGLSSWYTARTYDPAITLDTKADQQVLLLKIRVATEPPKVAK